MKNISIYFSGLLVLTLLSVNPRASYASSANARNIR